MIGNHEGGIREVELTPAQARTISVLILKHLDGNMDIQEPTYSNEVWIHFRNQRNRETHAILIGEDGIVKRFIHNDVAS